MPKVVVFHAGKEEYALPIENVLSIEKVEEIRPIPHLPQFVMGIIKVREEMIPVLDLGNILYGTSAATETGMFLLVVQTKTLQIGLVVKEAKEILEVSDESITNVGLLAYSKTNYFSGIINLEDKMITQIDADVLVESLESIKEIKDYVNDQKAHQN
ncbi:chemotaxis protein CheW [Rossellomorea sp. YZS02]|uniref:chemotaxis protein CheW n=1 Tax=Rossellomorea sp. YZS02 TaxID=3097358 RepID=UPI002A15AD24|nr:chemotaxis protein CheW [Rossellomorea sp. YZS02]MDX8344865.1 chemotaxis protein CheW [Rossellomorea sp. YZS02]